MRKTGSVRRDRIGGQRKGYRMQVGIAHPIECRQSHIRNFDPRMLMTSIERVQTNTRATRALTCFLKSMTATSHLRHTVTYTVR